jgi:RHS repeat-associated protein
VNRLLVAANDYLTTLSASEPAWLSQPNTRILGGVGKYDAAGNSTGDPGGTCAFDGQNRLANAATSLNPTVSGYGADGRRAMRSGTSCFGQTQAVRQLFTGKERDGAMGLDYFGARCFPAAQGRFTRVDPALTVQRLPPIQTVGARLGSGQSLAALSKEAGTWAPSFTGTGQFWRR